MGIHAFKGTGRAKCKMCKHIIEKDEISVTFTGYRVSDQYHKSCIDDLVLQNVRY